MFLTLGIFNGFGQSQKNDIKVAISALPLFGSSGSFSGINGLVIKPSLGYYVSNKTSIELNLSYATLDYLKVGNVDSHYNSFAFIPTLRHHFVNKQNLRFFAELGFGLGTIKYGADEHDSRYYQHNDLSGGISILNIGVGGNYFFNDRFGLELIIPYLRSHNITSDQTNTIYSGIGPTVGITYKLN